MKSGDELGLPERGPSFGRRVADSTQHPYNTVAARDLDVVHQEVAWVDYGSVFAQHKGQGSGERRESRLRDGLRSMGGKINIAEGRTETLEEGWKRYSRREDRTLEGEEETVMGGSQDGPRSAARGELAKVYEENVAAGRPKGSGEGTDIPQPSLGITGPVPSQHGNHSTHDPADSPTRPARASPQAGQRWCSMRRGGR